MKQNELLFTAVTTVQLACFSAWHSKCYRTPLPVWLDTVVYSVNRSLSLAQLNILPGLPVEMCVFVGAVVAPHAYSSVSIDVLDVLLGSCSVYRIEQLASELTGFVRGGIGNGTRCWRPRYLTGQVKIESRVWRFGGVFCLFGIDGALVMHELWRLTALDG